MPSVDWQLSFCTRLRVCAPRHASRPQASPSNAETLVASIDFPDIPGSPLTGDDAGGRTPPVSTASKGDQIAQLADGYRLIWERPDKLAPGRLASFQFRVEDQAGKPAEDMELYMGMQGHAAFVKTDGTVFAHIHPSGTVAMAALALAQPDPHAGHMGHSAIPALVSFPYALPTSGAYRIIVQVKRGGHVETAVFDANC